ERADPHLIPHHLQVQNHQAGRIEVVSVDEEPGFRQVGPRLDTEPAHDGHPAIVSLEIDKDVSPRSWSRWTSSQGSARWAMQSSAVRTQTASGYSARKLAPRAGSSSMNKTL